MDKCPKCHAPARCGPPDGDFRYVPPINYRDELTAANKAIVALSEALDDMHAYSFHSYIGTPTYDKVISALTTHAPAIEKARGG